MIIYQPTLKMSGKLYEIVLNGQSFQRPYDNCELSDMKADLSFFPFQYYYYKKMCFQGHS